MGVNLGDVIVEDEDCHGEGVNIAARLQQLAEPGGICISQQAYDHVEAKLSLAYDDLGEHLVKNIVKPVHVYRVRGAATRAPRRRVQAPASRPARWPPDAGRARRPGGAIVWYLIDSNPSPPPPGPKIAVMSFSVPAAIHAMRLSAPDWPKISARRLPDSATYSSSLANRPVGSRARTSSAEIGRGVGVGYVLDGSVRCSASGLLACHRAVVRRGRSHSRGVG